MTGKHSQKRKYSQEEIEQKMSGRIYANPDDLNIFVRRKGFCSWTMNLGNIWSRVLMGSEILLIAVILSAIR